MASSLLITPRHADKSARFYGLVAAGEHVAVAIKDAAAWLGSTPSESTLRLRVVGTNGKTLAQFPIPDSAGTWTVNGLDAACELNLNTHQMLCAVPQGATRPLLFVLDDPENHVIYFKDLCHIGHWPRPVGAEVPLNLDDYPDILAETQAAIAEYEERISSVETRVSGVEDNVSGMENAISSFDSRIQHTETVVGDLNARIDSAADLAPVQSVNGKIGDVVLGVSDISGAYEKPQAGIPKTDLASDVQTSLGKADTALQAHQDISAKADLVNGKVPASQLPSYVDDVLEYASQSAFPVTGEDGKIYVDKTTNKAYRWSGSAYVEVSPTPAPVAPASATAAGQYADALAVKTELADKVSKTGAQMTGNLELLNTSLVVKPRSGLLGGKQTTYSNGEIIVGAVASPSSDTLTLPSASGTLALLSNIPTLYAWALAATKPSYTASEVGALAADSAMAPSSSADDIGAPADAHYTYLALLSKAPLASPAFTGTPTAPTAAAGMNTTQIATTAFVQNAIGSISVTPLANQSYDFATMQGVINAVAAVARALGATVTNVPGESSGQ